MSVSPTPRLPSPPSPVPESPGEGTIEAGERPRAARSIRRLPALLLGVLTLLGPLATSSPLPAREQPKGADDFLVVDCLLPGKVRRLGRRQTYVSRRRPIRTTALDCRIRGGEYTSYDRASYATALSVWLEEAREGSAEAQYYVGQIFEKGLGPDPDFAAAAEWYRKAAEQGHSGAQTSLGFLYETGLGVEKDPEQALHWYRRAAGLPDELVVLEREEHEDLLGRLEEREREMRELENRVQELQGELDRARERGGEAQESVRSLEARVADLQGDLARRRQEVRSLEERLASGPLPEETPGANLGPYHALVIGNREYAHLPDVPSAETDARALARVLEERYGFRVHLLIDASRYQILEALNQLREKLTEKDNLVIFYAGHSHEDPEARRGWWQPVDAVPDRRANWISDRVISDHLEVLSAKHVLVLADAAFPAMLTRSSIPTLRQGMSPERRAEYLREMADRRTRLVLASGRDPTGETVREGSSFTEALLETLLSNDQILEASDLYLRLARQVRDREDEIGFAPIRWSRHESGSDFFFVPAG